MNKILILLITILFGVNVFGQSGENSEPVGASLPNSAAPSINKLTTVPARV
ncbi:MAG: hypothetical protein IT258_06460 [Saprospiraceae bacterium]|nr:hypothetical protein [Saprospiraceae bacterium]